MTKKPYNRPTIKKILAGMPAKVGTSTMAKTFSEIDGVSINELMDKYGSPLFVISETKLRETIRSAQNAFNTRYPKVQFAWSYKTNYLSAVCNVFHQEGCIAEVVSGFEYRKALKNGVPGDKIIFNGPDKTVEDLKMAMENNSLIHIDHFDELQELTRLAKEAGKKPKVALRLNMDTGIYPLWDRFGFNFESGQAWDAITRVIKSGCLELVGLHTHIGTYILELNAYKVATEKIMHLYATIRFKFEHTLSYIDLGGGFASKNTLRGAYLPASETTPSFAQYAETISNAIKGSLGPSEPMPILFLETGRALIDEAGYLLGSVLANKRLSDGRKALIVDYGVNILFTAFWYEHEISLVEPTSQGHEKATIYGPLCMNIDVVRSQAELPALEKGDRMVVHRVGAYNMTQWLQFIQMRPNVVMIDTKGKDHLIRLAETLEAVDSLEKIPGHLGEFKI